MLPHPTPGDHDLIKLESVLTENAVTQVSAFLADRFLMILFFKDLLSIRIR